MGANGKRAIVTGQRGQAGDHTLLVAAPQVNAGDGPARAIAAHAFGAVGAHPIATAAGFGDVERAVGANGQAARVVQAAGDHIQGIGIRLHSGPWHKRQGEHKDEREKDKPQPFHNPFLPCMSVTTIWNALGGGRIIP